VNKNYDVVVIGGSIGGILAAISLCKMGKKVALTEQTDWIGGQLTSQAVPSDEHEFIEEFGCTATYKTFRSKVREHYRNHPHIKDEYKTMEIFNPGEGWVSRIASEPRVSLGIFHDMIRPFQDAGLLHLYLNTKAVSSNKSLDSVKDITVINVISNIETVLQAAYFIDATDIGELLPLTQTDYYYGAEARDEYDEPLAPLVACKEDMQPITWVAAIAYAEGEDHTIPRPDEYDYFRNYILEYDNHPILSWYGPDAHTGKKREFKMIGPWNKQLFNNSIPPLFPYRQIIDKHKFKNDFYTEDVTLLNWPQNDYVMGNIFEDNDAIYHQHMSRELTKSLIYWLQTEAKRHDNDGFGYPEIKLRGDIVGTNDGLAKAPYIRESRRIKALYTIKEKDISATHNQTLPTFWDSVGVGCYHIDLHMTTVSNSFFFDNTWPFEIPLGSFIPVKTKNLIPACKNIGTTHITNGCFRLHPVEWNIGESAGYLVSFCMDHNITPQSLYADKQLVKQFQEFLVKQGIEIHWPKDKVHVI
jgi:hypothetical protein